MPSIVVSFYWFLHGAFLHLVLSCPSLFLPLLRVVSLAPRMWPSSGAMFHLLSCHSCLLLWSSLCLSCYVCPHLHRPPYVAMLHVLSCCSLDSLPGQPLAYRCTCHLVVAILKCHQRLFRGINRVHCSLASQLVIITHPLKVPIVGRNAAC